jgi:rubrerythrin
MKRSTIPVDSESDSDSEIMTKAQQNKLKTSQKANGKIYRLSSPRSMFVFYGSTFEDLDKQLHKHETRYEGLVAGKKYLKMSDMEVFGHGKVKIELVKSFPQISNEELKEELKDVIRQADKSVHKLVANIRVPGRTQEEYRADHKLTKSEYDKKRHAEKKNEISEKRKEAYQKVNAEKYTCTCGAVINRTSLPSHLKSKKHQQNN